MNSSVKSKRIRRLQAVLAEYKSIVDQIIHPFTVVPRLAWQLVQLWNATYKYIHNPYIFSKDKWTLDGKNWV